MEAGKSLVGAELRFLLGGRHDQEKCAFFVAWRNLIRHPWCPHWPGPPSQQGKKSYRVLSKEYKSRVRATRHSLCISEAAVGCPSTRGRVPPNSAGSSH